MLSASGLLVVTSPGRRVGKIWLALLRQRTRRAGLTSTGLANFADLTNPTLLARPLQGHRAGDANASGAMDILATICGPALIVLDNCEIPCWRVRPPS